MQTVFTPTNQTKIDCSLPINTLQQLKGRRQAENPCPKIKTFMFLGQLGYYKLKWHPEAQGGNSLHIPSPPAKQPFSFIASVAKLFSVMGKRGE